MEKRLSIDKELRILWKLCLGLEENVKSVKKYVKRVETARYQQKNTQPQAEENEPDKVYVDPIVPDFIKEPPIPAVFKTREEVMRMFESTPEQKEEWEKRFDKRYDQYNPINDDGTQVATWCGSDYEDMKSFISELLSEREREVANKFEKIIRKHEKYIGEDYATYLGNPTVLLEELHRAVLESKLTTK